MCPEGFDQDGDRCRRCPSDMPQVERDMCWASCPTGLEMKCPNEVCGCYPQGSPETSVAVSMACPANLMYSEERDGRKCVAPKPKLGVCASCPTGSLYAPKGLGATAISAARCVECPTRRRAGARRAGQCDSADGENKFIADILSYFTGQPAATQKFGFCLPTGTPNKP